MPKPANTPAPRPPDEGELLAWIEGERLPRERELAVAMALSQDAALARRLELMRADRDALGSLPSPAAPAGLMDAVEAALQPVLERQMLVGMEASADAPLPISMVQPAKRSVFDVFLRDRMGRRMAAAAGLLLLVGGATYFATSYFSGTAPAPNLARGPVDAGPEAVAGAATAPRTEGGGGTPATAEAGTPEGDAGTAIAAAPAPEVDPAGAEPPAPVIITQQYGPPAPDGAVVALDMARAAELALESRLVIRLRTADPLVRAQPDRLADRIRRAESPAWKLGGEVPPAALAVLNPPVAPARQPRERTFEPPVLADDDKPIEILSLPAPPVLAPLPPQPPKPAAFMVQTRLDPAALETLRSAIASRHGEAVFEELAEPLPLNDGPSLNPAAVLWWSQSPAGWTRWAEVPVVIDAFR